MWGRRSCVEECLSSGCTTDYHRLTDLKIRSLLKVLEAGKSEIKMLVGLFNDETLFLACRRLFSPWIFIWQREREREREREGGREGGRERKQALSCVFL